MEESSGKDNLKSNDIKNYKSEKTKTNINCLKSFNSLYMIKETFSFLSIKQKLNIIKYNKILQKKLGIEFEEYKKISIRCKILFDYFLTIKLLKSKINSISLNIDIFI